MCVGYSIFDCVAHLLLLARFAFVRVSPSSISLSVFALCMYSSLILVPHPCFVGHLRGATRNISRSLCHFTVHFQVGMGGWEAGLASVCV